MLWSLKAAALPAASRATRPPSCMQPGPGAYTLDSAVGKQAPSTKDAVASAAFSKGERPALMLTSTADVGPEYGCGALRRARRPRAPSRSTPRGASSRRRARCQRKGEEGGFHARRFTSSLRGAGIPQADRVPQAATSIPHGRHGMKCAHSRCSPQRCAFKHKSRPEQPNRRHHLSCGDVH